MSTGTTFCTACGAAVNPSFGNYLAAGSLNWERKIPLITNPYLVLQCIFIPLGIAIVMGSFLSIVTGGEWDLLLMFLILGAGFSVLMLIIMLVLQLVTGGGLETEFFISNEGVAHKAGATTRALDRASTGSLGMLGSLSGTGAGLIAISQENNALMWKDVRYVSVYPGVLSIVFRSKYLVSPVVLYCTEENFPIVRAMVKKYAPVVATKQI